MKPRDKFVGSFSVARINEENRVFSNISHVHCHLLITRGCKYCKSKINPRGEYVGTNKHGYEFAHLPCYEENTLIGGPNVLLY